MTDQAIKPASDHLDIAYVERWIKAIFIGSVGNLVEWYDFIFLSLMIYSSMRDTKHASVMHRHE